MTRRREPTNTPRATVKTSRTRIGRRTHHTHCDVERGALRVKSDQVSCDLEQENRGFIEDHHGTVMKGIENSIDDGGRVWCKLELTAYWSFSYPSGFVIPFVS
jgi:hypothetical protein